MERKTESSVSLKKISKQSYLFNFQLELHTYYDSFPNRNHLHNIFSKKKKKINAYSFC